ncbi:MAG TPA: hypothetical protein VEG39_15870 [Clostridia bacterium]|nr:hypothetical protein [Clostridia bacterium]
MEENVMNMFKQIINRLDNIETDVKDLKQGQERIENKLDNMEVVNANRHVEINGRLNDISTNLTVVEAVTGKT